MNSMNDQIDRATGSTASSRRLKTIEQRVKWLVNFKFDGNRSSLAAALQMSHTAVNKVMAGYPPGRKFVAALIEAININPTWLYTGEGNPFRDRERADQPYGAPVAEELLLGSPQEHRPPLTYRWPNDPDQLFTPTQYWLRLKSRMEIVKGKRFGLMAGDMLLFETDRDKFPRRRHLHEKLCVISLQSEAKDVELGMVSYVGGSADEGPGRLIVELFGPGTEDHGLVKETIFREYSDGVIRQHERHFPKPEGRKRKHHASWSWINGQAPALELRYSQIHAVWLGLIWRKFLLF